jgi:hypothetical protein
MSANDETTETTETTKKKYNITPTEFIDIDENAETTKKVNCVRGVKLLYPYFLIDDKLYKKTGLGMYRVLKQQKNRGYTYYYVTDADKKSRMVNITKLDDLTYMDPSADPSADPPTEPSRESPMD